MITLKTLPQATEQEVFDQVAAHLLKQNKRSMGLVNISSHMQQETCVYRSCDGLSCAAGCLIADDEYKASMEGRSWKGLINSKQVPEFNSKLIKKLQDIHDYIEPSDWRQELERLASKEDLTFKYSER